jgi:uncharacterized protein (DUF1499 family)
MFGNLKKKLLLRSKRQSSRAKTNRAKHLQGAIVRCIVRGPAQYGKRQRPASDHLVHLAPLTPQTIGTAMKFNKIIAGVIVSVVLLASLPFALGLIWPRINDVKTGATPEYPDLQPQRFNQPPAEVFSAALEVAKSMGWEIREADEKTGTIEAIATTRLLKFKDDVTITIAGEGNAAVVNLRSKSRIGKGDLGANARRIRAFQAELAKRF